jgi:hypothetical protein
MLAKLASAHNLQTRSKFYVMYLFRYSTLTSELRSKSISPSEAEGVVRKAINIRLDSAPPRPFDTTTGLLCDREAQISAFKTSTEYNELLLLIATHPDLPFGRITDTVAMYFRYLIDGKGTSRYFTSRIRPYTSRRRLAV